MGGANLNPLTILHADSEKTWRGGQRQVLELCKGLNSRGHRNIIVCRKGGELAKRARDAGVEVITLPFRGEWDIMTGWQLGKLVKSMHADILHAHSSHAHMIGIYARIMNPGCRFIVARRVDFHVTGRLRRTLKYGRSVDRIITVSNAIRRILIEDGLDSDKMVTVRSGFIPGQFPSVRTKRDIRAELGISTDTVVVITVAALAPHKALHTLLKAAAQVFRQTENVRFLIAGDGELREIIQQHITSLGLDQNVTLLGFVDDIEAVFRSADIFAMSSREEGLCTSILDAMHFRLPIVSTNAGGIPELVQHGINGLLGAVDEYTLFAENLLTLISDSDRRTKMGERGRRLLDQFSIDRTIDETLGVYRELDE